MEQDYKYMVAVRCYTFGHARYINDTLNGFVSQETSFPVLFLVVDDASVDGEQAILRLWADSNLVAEAEESLWCKMPYGDMAKGKLRFNSNISFVLFLLSENHYNKHLSKKTYIYDWLNAAKYTAVCEGDDYWIDNCKLQKQVNYMEQNDDYTLCFHSVYEVFEGRPSLNKVRACIEDRDYSGLEWYKKRPSQFASFLFRSWVERTSFYKRIEDNKSFVARDVPLLLSCAHLGKIRGMSDVMSVYRHNETGWTQKKHSKDNLIRIAESELHYAVFGEEFKSQGESFYCLALVRAFVNTIASRDKAIDYDYIKLAWRKSKRKTIMSFFILARKLSKKYLKV